MLHPDYNRPLSVAECAALQQFPRRWQFAGSVAQQYVQIGNAVPVGLGKAVGKAIRDTLNKRNDAEKLGTIECPNEDLIARLERRPVTILNPPHMRIVQDTDKAREWLDQCGKREPLVDYIS